MAFKATQGAEATVENGRLRLGWGTRLGDPMRQEQTQPDEGRRWRSGKGEARDDEIRSDQMG